MSGNKVVSLVNEWALFEEQHPEADIEDFCRYYLISRKKETEPEEIAFGLVPPGTNAFLMKVIGRIGRIFEKYARMALSEADIPVPEGFPFINSLKLLGESRKTDIINYNMTEFTTGIEILNRLKKEELITERADENDRRAKLVKITPKGEAYLYQCYDKLTKVVDFMLHGMAEEDKKLCIQLLKDIEITHTEYCMTMRNKTIDQIAVELMPGR